MSDRVSTTFSHALRIKGFMDTPSLFEEVLPDGTPVFHTAPCGDIALPSDMAAMEATRLGQVAEGCFSAWLEAHPRYERRVQNLQVIADGHTLGEIDFIVDDLRAGRTLHIELAYKIYVLQDLEEGLRWVGPNGRDSLRGKLQKLRSRQFPLAAHPVSRKALDAMGVASEALQPAACIKGQLYVPRGYRGALPDGLNSEAVAGAMMTRTEFESLELGPCTFFIPGGPDRMLHPRGAPAGWTDKAAVVRTLSGSQRPEMVWVSHADGGYERFMVM